MSQRKEGHRNIETRLDPTSFADITHGLTSCVTTVVRPPSIATVPIPNTILNCVDDAPCLACFFCLLWLMHPRWTVWTEG